MPLLAVTQSQHFTEKARSQPGILGHYMVNLQMSWPKWFIIKRLFIGCIVVIVDRRICLGSSPDFSSFHNSVEK